MLKKLVIVVKKVCFAVIVLYGLNLILSSINIFIPLNIATVSSISVLGFPGYIALLLMNFIIK